MLDSLRNTAPLALVVSSVLVTGCRCNGPSQDVPSKAQAAAASGKPTKQMGIEQARMTNPPTDVALSAASFNPSLEESVEIHYEIAQADRVTVHVYDADGGLVRTLVDAAERDAGTHKETWDGRDDDDRLVPDEAYTFTIETASGGVYDPTTFSGGAVNDIRDAQFDWDGGTVSYKLPAPARVLIRLGIHSGPMLKTLVDWKPRIATTITEYWDGRDEDRLMSLRGREEFSALITYVTLPDATVIAYGNDEQTYRAYKLRREDGQKKPNRPRQADSELRLRPEGLVPPAWSRAPQVLLTLPKYDDGDGADNHVPEVYELVDVRVDVHESDKDLLLRDQFEIIFFVDNVFFAEAERGYLPFNWRWELQQLPPGEHVLTVNVASFRGQVGVASRKVDVQRASK